MHGNLGRRSTRRRFLQTTFAAAGLTAAGALMAACAPAPAPTATPAPAAPPTPTPAPAAAAAPTPTKAPATPTKAPEPTPTMVPAVPKEKAKLTLWAPKHFLPAQNDYITESMKLAAQKGNFEVEVQMFPWGELNQKFAAAIEAKTLPDAALGVDVPRYRAMNLLVDVSDLFKEVGESGGGWLDVAISGVTFKGKKLSQKT